MLKKEIEFTQVVTRGGDKGESSLYDGSRKRKDDIVFEALGDIDELISHLGSLYIYNKKVFKPIQTTLMQISALIATSPNSQQYSSLKQIKDKDIIILEKRILILMKGMIIESKFYLPDEFTAPIDIARTITRRCERRIVTLIRDNSMHHLVHSQKYLNRLSDFLWVYARHIGSK